ncbi:unnamed protein product [Fusarium venenatum]|uniref:Uncharacterized protein n=1 Tax=Fusarium venenatum TaxID=56646 RepID=A0A2L2T2J5_9HYPO|nr:uncharacterized protein FVRRES_13034 [Fusarium venenatum]CEI40343.1 unnamed protein product [Fusarium venenatum]
MSDTIHLNASHIPLLRGFLATFQARIDGLFVRFSNSANSETMYPNQTASCCDTWIFSYTNAAWNSVGTFRLTEHTRSSGIWFSHLNSDLLALELERICCRKYVIMDKLSIEKSKDCQ